MAALPQPTATSQRQTVRQDLRAEMRLKNNVLWRAVHDQYGSVAALCRAHPALKNQRSHICHLLNFKLYPLKKKRDGTTGLWHYGNQHRSICVWLETILRTPAEDLFPQKLCDRFHGQRTAMAVEISSFTALPLATRRAIRALSDPIEAPDAQASRHELAEALEEALRTLSDRERKIIKLRFALADGNRFCTLRQIGRLFKIGSERVRQIENKALYKLRRSARLASFLEESN